MSIRPLPTALAEKARVELNEDPKRLQNDLQSIKDWIAKQPHLNARTEDQWLVAFLRGCKYSLERTKEKLDNYYSLWSTVPEMDRIKHTDPLFDEILSLGVSVMLPKTSEPNAPRINLMRPGKYDPNKYNLFDIMSVNNVIMKILLIDDDQATIAGIEGIGDFDGVTMSHLLQMTPVSMKKMVAMGQDASPLRIKGSHYLNTPTGFETVFNMIKGLLNEKNRNRLYVHNKNYEALYQRIPKEILPTEYGGQGGALEEIIEYWRNKVKEYSSWLEEDLKYGTDESKRPGKPRTTEEMFGSDDDQWLVAFLRGCKFSLERTKEKLDNYYSLRSTVPELERIKCNDPLFDEILSLGVSVILPNTSGSDGRRINLMRPGKYDPNKYHIMDIMSVNFTLQKILFVDDDHMTVCGIESIGDMEGVTLGHFLQMTPVVMKKVVSMGQDAAPLRIKGTHYLNTPPGFETVFNLMKSFLNEKNKNRLYVHNKNYEEMYKYIPKEILPAEYGGNGGSIEEIIDYWRAKVKEYSAWLEEDLKYKTDESKRPGKPRTAEDMFGVEGSFRQLEFD